MDVTEIQEVLKKDRPHLRPTTLKSYAYNIRRVHNMIESKEFEKNAKKLEGKLKDTKASVGRALVNAVIVYEKAKGRKKTEELEKLKARLDTEFTDSVKL